ncbi:MAG: flagellar assembly protein H [Alphaproteobacteria bacterium]|nr:flagellar assembly protein H [Alphaproteobacteria bacterium]
MDVTAKTGKFLFDVDFAREADPKERPIAAADHALKLAEAESKGFRDGYDTAVKENVAAAERRTAAAFEQISDSIDRLARAMTAIEARMETQAVELAVSVGRKLATELVAREPFDEIAALASDCFRQLTAAPHVVVRVNEALHQIARNRLEDIARQRGFDGRLVVVAEAEIKPGDCRIEWADGGLNRDMARTDETIGKTVERYLGPRRLAAALPELGDIRQ